MQAIKIWAYVGCRSWLGNKGGAWRIWSIAKHLDKIGSGKVSCAELRECLDELKVGKRKQRRWISQALKLKIITTDGKDYYMAGLGKTAVTLGARNIGKPSKIDINKLVNNGWRSAVWAGVLALHSDHPISRETLMSLTGIQTRTQVNLEQQLNITYRKNYARTEIEGDHLTGIKDSGRETAFIGSDGNIIYRLPDIRIIDESEAIPAAKGRSGKAQKRANSLSNEGQDNTAKIKLFHEQPKSAESTKRNIAKMGLPSWGNHYNEVFCLEHAGRNNNVWRVNNVQS